MNNSKSLANRLAIACISVIAFLGLLTAVPVRAQEVRELYAQLEDWEETALREGQTIITGEKGKYLAKILIAASPETVWSVLTDYNNLSSFLPNTVSSKIIESADNRWVVEQIDERQVLGVTARSRLVTESIQTPKSRIDFRLIDGDLQSMQGYWQLQELSASNQAKPELLLEYSVEAQPNPGIPKIAFYTIFRNSLKPTLNAIREESERRNN
ncbi:MAG: cyclase/dehydrase [Oscillatoria sp. SIO1A7]|nr:cyclase/dehydrase [Oscillatoria sp. SIO1A7]